MANISSKKTGPWTEAENYSICLQVLAQISGTVDMNKVIIAGRTARAVSHRWAKIKQEAAAEANKWANSPTATPSKNNKGPTSPNPKRAKVSGFRLPAKKHNRAEETTEQEPDMPELDDNSCDDDFFDNKGGFEA